MSIPIVSKQCKNSGSFPLQETTLAAAQKYCRTLTRKHYENFTVGSWLLPRSLRQHIANVYAFARIADDLADEESSPQQSLTLLDEWEYQLKACYKGEYHHPVFLALGETVREFAIPLTYFQNLLCAFRQDQLVKRYRTFDELLEYCQNSANPVGRIYLHLFHLESEERFRYSDAICTALQLTNFLQDVKRDHQLGRTYIPQEDLKWFGCHESDLERRYPSRRWKELIKFEVARTQKWFDYGKKLLPLVPGQPRFEIRLFIAGGEAILESLRKLDYNCLEERPSLRKWQKLHLLFTCWLENRLHHGDAV